MKLCSKEYQDMKIDLYSTPKPKMSWHKGRTWDIVTSIIIDKVEIKIHLETTWGKYGYFNLEEKWYKIPAIDVDRLGYKKEFFIERKRHT